MREMPRTLSANDRIVLRWAFSNRYDCRDRRVADGNEICLIVRLNHATVAFQDGRLTELLVPRIGRFTHERAAEFASLFALCGYLEARRQDARRPGTHDAGFEIRQTSDGRMGNLGPAVPMERDRFNARSC